MKPLPICPAPSGAGQMGEVRFFFVMVKTRKVVDPCGYKLLTHRHMDHIETLGRPPLLSGYYRFGQRYRLDPDAVFVFGSNLKGIHGKGAAATAHKFFGAQFGKGDGYTGQAYALATKYDPKTSLSIDEVAKNIRKFASVTDMSLFATELAPGVERDDFMPFFYVTPVGTGLAGFSHEQIAPLFQGVVNCWLPDIWEPFLGPYPGIARAYQDDFIRRHGLPKERP